jgi:hypothetical protein
MYSIILAFFGISFIANTPCPWILDFLISTNSDFVLSGMPKILNFILSP